MKKLLLTAVLAFGIGYTSQAQNVAINTDGIVADNSAILDVKASNKGVLVPRMLDTDKTGITNPATGLIIYQTNGTAGFYYNAGTPASPSWIRLNDGVTSIANGGTGATTQAGARTNLGLGTLATASTVTTAEITDGTIATTDIANNAVTVAKLPTGATGTTFLRGDGTWQTPASGGSTSPLYGDGSAGALNITTNTDWSTTPPSSFNVQYSSINVASGITFTVPSGTKLRSNGIVTISGTITVLGSETSKLFPSDRGIIARNAASTGAAFAVGAFQTTLMSLINIPPYAGSQGGYSTVGDQNYAGFGGGSFAIYANGTITIGGTINANGGNAFSGSSVANSSINGSGGGGGGLVVLVSKQSITNTGTIAAKGGNGSNGIIGTTSTRPGGGGGGGGIIILASPINTAGTANVNGGNAGANSTAGTATSSSGGSGGACGGNGGSAGIGLTPAQPTTPVAGSSGILKTITVTNPENLY